MIDAVPTTILHDLVLRFVDDLQEYLLERLDASSEGAAERFAQLLKEDPKVERERGITGEQGLELSAAWALTNLLSVKAQTARYDGKPNARTRLKTR